MLFTILRTLLFAVLAPAVGLYAQDPPPPAASPLTTHGKFVYGVTQKIVIRAAENMPEQHFAYKPVDSVRTFGQIVGHIADSNYGFCAVVLGEKSPGLQIEKTKTSKTDLIAALEDAFAYCDRAYATVNDTTGTQMVKLMGTEMPKLGVLSINQLHTMEHYGNIVTYMRMKNLVPPTSEPDFMRQMQPAKK